MTADGPARGTDGRPHWHRGLRRRGGRMTGSKYAAVHPVHRCGSRSAETAPLFAHVGRAILFELSRSAMPLRDVGGTGVVGSSRDLVRARGSAREPRPRDADPDGQVIAHDVFEARAQLPLLRCR